MSDCVGRESCFRSCVRAPDFEMEDGHTIFQRNVPNDDRIQHMRDVFKREFRADAVFFVKVPGRVNLIGEHIDYCGFPVLPMALEQDILIAAAPTGEKYAHIKNVNKKYTEYKISLKNFDSVKIKPDGNGRPFWYNYVLCGIKGAMEYLNKTCDCGLKMMVEGNIPPASGLSSSSALVSASCLAFLHAHKAQITKKDIATLCATSERYIGTQGGGMDQAIAFLAQKNSAQYISFLPLDASPVELPENAVFVIAHSLAEANKAATNEFNTRVVECRMAAHVIAHVEEIETGSRIITLRDLLECQDSTLDDMIKQVRRALPQDNYTLEEVSSILTVDKNNLRNMFLTENTKDLKNFKLRQRALHVYEETRRVEQFRKLCTESRNDDNVVSALGNLMSESHESLKTLYECSHPNLDILVDLSKKFGVHARLTGAGWGGCAVAICREEEVNTYIDYLTNEFYIKLYNQERENISQYLFATSPNDGAVVYHD